VETLWKRYRAPGVGRVASAFTPTVPIVDGNADRRTIRLADIRVSRVAVEAFRWGFSPWGIWVLRERRRNHEQIKGDLTKFSEELGGYLSRAQKIQIEGQATARSIRNLTWVIAGLTLANVVLVAVTLLR
jgi:hypothetical protein